MRMMRPGASASAAVRAETRDDLEDVVLKDTLGISRDARAKLLPTDYNVNSICVRNQIFAIELTPTFDPDRYSKKLP